MLILASGSPRREEILLSAGFSFKIIPSGAEEKLSAEMKTALSPAEKAVYIASVKAKSVADMLINGEETNEKNVIIGADTIVVAINEYGETEIMGKPINSGDAFRMLSMLSGTLHTVISGVYIISGNREESFYESTDVEFYLLSEDEINGYITTGEPFDKAGAYGIQGKGMALVKRINGDFYNVMGLPVGRLIRVLKEIR